MRVSLDDSWSQGDKAYQVINLFITNTGKSPVAVPWQLEVTNSAYTSLSQVSIQVTMTHPGCQCIPELRLSIHPVW